jgi:hypothetical protein
VILACTAALLGTLAPRAAAAQGEAPRWLVQRDAFAELWYHGLATVGGDDYGPLPLYSASYVRAVRETKRARGITTPLDSAAATLRAAFAADSSFDALHFVPLYFVGVEPGAALAALREALAGGQAASSVPLPLAARAAAVARSIAGMRNRRAALTFVDALAAEWLGVVRDERAMWQPSARTVLDLQHDWDTSFARPLSSYLTAGGRSTGTIVVVPALGREGRVVSLRGGISVVMVSADAVAGVDDAPLFSAVRELAFSLLDEVPAGRLTAAVDRLAAEREREVAAVRGGAMLLEAVAPPLAPSYRRVFMTAVAGEETRAFERAYPLDPRAQRALRAAAARYSPPQSTQE